MIVSLFGLDVGPSVYLVGGMILGLGIIGSAVIEGWKRLTRRLARHRRQGSPPE
jgi:hypothetical protein